jgi:hypothetical protein
MAKNNVWRMTAKDKDGKPVEAAPGMTVFTMRGPEDLKTVTLHANILLNSLRKRQWQNTGVDPEYQVVEIKPAGFSDQTADVGTWRPPGAAPVSLPLPPDEQGNPQTERRGRTTRE